MSEATRLIPQEVPAMTEDVLDELPGVPAVRPGPPDFRALMSAFPTGVAVVTATGADGSPWGMTCSSVTSITTDPPTLLVSLRRGSPTLSGVLQGGAFAVNFLHHRGQGAAELFASGDPDRFDRITWRGGVGFAGPHLPEDAHAVADCRVDRIMSVGDHTVILGEVYLIETHEAGDPRPLLYGLRRYSSWSAGDRDEAGLR